MAENDKPVNRPFRTLLIANRGEIACRIIRTARRMGLRTIAVYSDADRTALHVALADQAIRLGPPAARESYLRIDRIIEAAQESGAEAIHPGYGFLSENADFAAACDAAGLIFVGPKSETILAMGSKSGAKSILESSAVPLVPGYHGEKQDLETFHQVAEEIGYPVLIKAAAGGGGKGMRVVDGPEGMADAIAGAKRESASSFGDDRLLVEKYIVRPRHIEVQVIGDIQGKVLSLFERECTLQRRHQKVIEEAPSSTMTLGQREAICAAGRAVAETLGYVGAGTVEFVFNDQGFYFIEMNTRLQVEHPVTEMITGLDLVELQLRVAAGEPLPLEQGDVRLLGHAVEARIYAEDPAKGFLPSTGRIDRWDVPSEQAVRIDTGYRAGDTVSSFYDPMIAKLIVHGDDRGQAFRALSHALGRMHISGIETNVDFLGRLVSHESVLSGDMHTGFIEQNLVALTARAASDARDIAAAIAVVLDSEGYGRQAQSAWDEADGWMMVGERQRSFALDYGDASLKAELTYGRAGLVLEIDGARQSFSIDKAGETRILVGLGEAAEAVSGHRRGAEIDLMTPRGRQVFTLIDQTLARGAASATAGHFRAPMPGIVRDVFVTAGQRVEKGAPVIAMEAMKMEYLMRAPDNGTVSTIRHAAGDFVGEGTELVTFQADGDTHG
jgi:3-methylcrotonyl-CoA carboxylase alpha subunit